MNILAQVALGVGAMGATGLTWGALEARAFTTRQVRVPVLPPGTPTLRVLHISDLHLTPRQTAKAKWVRSLGALEPDLVVNTGDNLAHVDAVDPLCEALAPLLALPGVFVNGSNDYFAPTLKNPFTYFRAPTRIARNPERLPTDAMVAQFAQAGWRDLNNGRAHFELRGVALSFVGMDDPHIKRDKIPPSAPAASALHIGVVHAPYVRALQALGADGATLMLAGHTHGGQVRIPGVGALVTNCDLDRGRARGLHGWPGPRPDMPRGEASRWLHVSAGAGTSPYAPVRFACRPEATLLELVAA